MFNPDFYPTPPEVAATMLDPLDLRGRVVVEPSAGSGNLIKACIERGAAEVLAVEPEPKLRAILAAIPDSRLIGSDWLKVTADQISHADLVVMNPPFSADEHHILHAWAIAPAGCEIVALCNANTIETGRWGSRASQQLRTLIEQYGSSQNLGPVFEDAERPTRVSVGMVRLTRPGQRVSGADEFDGFFLGPDDIEAEGQGLIKYRRSRDLVNRYVEACRIYDQQLEAGVRLQAQVGGIYKGELGIQITMEGCAASRNRFRKELQKSFWESVIAEMLPREMATSQLAGDINKFVEQQTKVPFTERNLFRMLQVIAGTTEQRIDRAVEAAFDELTRHTAENRWERRLPVQPEVHRALPGGEGLERRHSQPEAVERQLPQDPRSDQGALLHHRPALYRGGASSLWLRPGGARRLARLGLLRVQGLQEGHGPLQVQGPGGLGRPQCARGPDQGPRAAGEAPAQAHSQDHQMTTDISATLTERGSRYGRFTGHARITQDLKRVIAQHTPLGRTRLDGAHGDHLAPDQQEALDMICHKIGRIINGDPDYADSWHDIAGYAQLVADRLNGVER